MKYRVLSYALFLGSIFLTTIAPSQTVTFSRDILTDNSQSRLPIPPSDFNNDGRDDFIKNCGQTVNSPKFAVILSTADGVYAPQTCYQIPSGLPFDFAVGDFNNDGSLDIAVVSGSALYLYLNNGQGKFHQQGSVTTAVTTYYAVAADVNHDSTIDLICGATDSKLYVFFGNGDGTFRAGPTSPIDTAGRFAIGDFDGDGKGDVFFQVGVDYATTFAQVAYGDGQGHFQAPPKIVSDVAWAAYDVDGDGKSDLIGIPFDFSLHGNRYYKEVRIMHANANRTFTTQTIALSQCDPGGATPAVADFNGDAINDLMVAEASDCNGNGPFTVNLMLGKGDGTFQSEQPLYSSDVPTPYYFRVLRANRDSKPDVELIGEVFDPQGPTTERDILFTDTTPGNFPKCSPPNRALGFNICSPTRTVSRSTSVRFTIGAGNQTPGRKVEIWVDGKKMAENLKGFSHYSFLDTTLTLAPGTHRVGIFTAGWDNLVQQYMWTGGPGFTFPLTVGSGKCPPQGEGITVCSPLNDTTLASPVRAWAVGQLSRTTIVRMEVWVDGVKKFTTTGSGTLDTKLALASGLHQFTYYLIGADGTKLSNTVKATVK